MTRLAIRTMNKKRLAAVLLCTAVCAGLAGTALQNRDTLAGTRQITVAIDAGHQKKGDTRKEPIGPGSRRKKAKAASGTQGAATKVPESKLTLSVAKRLEQELKKRGYKVYMVRRKQNVNISNKKRALLVNKSGADICIRLHADAAGKRVSGASALYPTKNNPYVKKLSKRSRKLTGDVLKKYCKATGIRNRGLSGRNDLTGTNWSKVPVTLIEMGFMTNKKEDKKMQKSSFQKKMAKGIADGVDSYFGK